MDLVFEHVKADRGIILLLDAKSNELIPKVVRTRDEAEAEARRAALSATTKAQPPPKKSTPRAPSSITCSTTGEGVLSSNAMADQRFSKGKSVHNLGIRSALCVPIKARKLTDKGGDEIIGVIYIDSFGQELHLRPRAASPADGHRPAGGHGDPKRQAVSGQACRPSAWPPSAKPPPPFRTRSRTSSRPCAAAPTSSRWACAGSNLTQATKGWRIVDRNLDKIYNLTMNLLAYSKHARAADWR